MKIPKYIYRRYALFQIPSLIIISILSYFVHLYFNLPVWIVFLIITLWLIKDIVLFPFVWKSYRLSSGHNSSFVGKTGIALTILNPKGSVRINGEIWRAETSDGTIISKGKMIKVVSVKGLDLKVEEYYNNSGK